ncbi:FAD-binding oxidoreductase [Paenibacillus sp. P22]|uniref:NAD(P)/FAD-dependent oxidoreductase n=1 Tax=Paenibacillus sp. P22 TaxID=483908 RepID=UPI0004318098|nr:FAD-dependent oxidoreductase [Paenibacillus sp. P22]CDN42478.1 FAD dependent oxidoreductase [Paenibacillus sp. P22]
MLQFSNDIMMSELADRYGGQAAVRFYEQCRGAVGSLGRLAAAAGQWNDGFRPASSLYAASSEADEAKLVREFRMLEKNGFPVAWGASAAMPSSVAEAFPASMTTYGDALANPPRLARALLRMASDNGVPIFEESPVREVRRRGGSWVISAGDGEVSASHIVVATGYIPGISAASELKPILRRTYALATRPGSVPTGWPEDSMVWETARPYFYFRTTPDGRIVAGGLDEDRPDPAGDETFLRDRSDMLLSDLKRYFPDAEFEAEYAWCGTFGESADDLPFIGEDKEQPGIFHSMGCGGNGTVYSALAASMLLAALSGEKHPLADMLNPRRIIRQDDASGKRGRSLLA